MNPTFILSSKAEVFVSGIEQISGVSKRNFTSPVTYTVKAEDGSTKNYTVIVNLVSEIVKIESVIRIYPNPCNEFITIEGPSKSFIVTDISGRKVLDGHEKTANISSLNKGVYSMLVELLSGEKINVKLVKN